jgi:hypothetical protein
VSTHETVHLVAQATGVPVEAMVARDRTRIAARRVAILLMREAGMLWKEIGFEFDEPADWAHTNAKRAHEAIAAGDRVVCGFLRNALEAAQREELESQ